MREQVPELQDTSDESEEGTRVHEIASAMIEGFEEPLDMRGVSDEMLQAAWMYAECVREVVDQHPSSTGAVTERMVYARRIHPESFGTVDGHLFDKHTGELFIDDFKYGFRLIEVYENWQLINYAAGLLDTYHINGHDDRNIKIHFRIIQPRGYHSDGPIRPWSIMASDLQGYFDTLSKNAAKSLSDEAELHTGPHCRDCEARHACPAALQAGLQLYEVSAQPTPVELTSEALGVQLRIVKRAIKQLEYVESGLTAQAMGTVRNGGHVAGYRTGFGQSKLKWNVPDDEAGYLGELNGIDLEKRKLVTPTQAIELGLDPDLVAVCSSRPNGALKLIEDDGNYARKIFGGKQI